MVQNLNVLIGGGISPTLSRVFNQMQGMVRNVERAMQQATNTANVNTRSNQRNTSSLRQNREEAERTARAAERLARMRQRERDAVLQSGDAYRKLEYHMRNIQRFTGSQSFQRMQFGAGAALAGTGAAITGAGTAASRGDAARLDDLLTQSAVIQGKSLDELPGLKRLFMDSSRRGVTNQDVTVLASAFKDALTSGALDWNQAQTATVTSGKWATAVKADTQDIMAASVSGISKFKISPEQLNRFHAALATAGDMGNFEYRDMSKWFPQLGTHAQGLRLTGVEGAAKMGAMLQAVRTATGSSDTAGNNLFNLFEKLTSKEAQAGLAKEGINLRSLEMQADRFNKDPANIAAGKQTDIVTLILDRLSKKFQGKSEMQVATSLNEYFGDMQARQALAAMVKQRDLMESIGEAAKKRYATEESAEALWREKYDKSISSLEESWKSIDQAVKRVAITFGLSFKPMVQWMAGVVTKASDVAIAIMEWSPTLTSIVGPALSLGGVVLMTTAKFKLLSKAIQMLTGRTPFLGWGTRAIGMFNRLGAAGKTTLSWLARGVSWMASGGGRAFSWLVTQGQNLRFVLASLHIAARAGISRLAPIVGRGAMVLLRAFGPVLLRGLGLIFGVAGSVVMAAFAGWKIGEWLDEKLNISGRVSQWWAEISGLEKRLQDLSKPIATSDMNVGRLGMLTGEAGQRSREAAIKKWEAQMASAQERLAAKQSEWWTSDADEQEIATIKQEIALAEKSAQALRIQMARQSAGKAAFGEGPQAIAAAERQLAYMERVAMGGKDIGDLKATDARKYAEDLRSQLTEMRAKAAQLNSPGKMEHTTTLTIDVHGADAPGSGKAIADAVEARLAERDREVARSYHGSVSAGFVD